MLASSKLLLGGSCRSAVGQRGGRSDRLLKALGRSLATRARMGRTVAGQTKSVGAKTLRERLLGPTTGTPFVIGNMAVAGGAVVGLGALCYYGLGLSSELGAIERAALWPQYVQERIHTTYGYLGGSLSITAASAFAISKNPRMLRAVSGNSIWLLAGSLAAVIGTGALCRGVEYRPGVLGTKQAAWALHCATLGAVMAPLIYLGGPLLLRAAVYTAGVVGGLSAVAVCAPSEKFLMMGGPLAMGLGVVFASSVGTWFLPPNTALGAGLYSIAIYGGLLLFCAFLLYDTQRLIKQAEVYPYYGTSSLQQPQQSSFPYYGSTSMQPPSNNYSTAVDQFDPINAQLSIYLDVLNIFMRIAMIMAGQNRRK